MNGGATWSDHRLLCTGPGYSRGVNIAVDSWNTLRVAWYLDYTLNYEIYYLFAGGSFRPCPIHNINGDTL
ncbi:MAG: hypothetical protein H6P98_1092 [Candidatus Aminicenantes bacterium]|nr:hypothetical protein [Candidatus Aminicenantes bacterium]